MSYCPSCAELLEEVRLLKVQIEVADKAYQHLHGLRQKAEAQLATALQLTTAASIEHMQEK